MVEKMLNEVRAISVEQNKDLGVAYVMFCSNLEKKEAAYKGGDFDYTLEITPEQIAELREAVIAYDHREK